MGWEFLLDKFFYLYSSIQGDKLENLNTSLFSELNCQKLSQNWEFTLHKFLKTIAIEIISLPLRTDGQHYPQKKVFLLKHNLTKPRAIVSL
jgi:hypothetical protein